ncbi:MAG: hypothetical protein QOH06_4152 [Acidobacteriota bacterium]|nr:hypothetical protein [Acidobacteriota bacterium]
MACRPQNRHRGSSGSDRKSDDPLARQIRGVSHCRLDRFARQRGIAAEDLLDVQTGCQIVEHHGHHDPCAPDAGLPMADQGVDGDVVSPVHTRTIEQAARRVKPGPLSTRAADGTIPPTPRRVRPAVRTARVAERSAREPARTVSPAARTVGVGSRTVQPAMRTVGIGSRMVQPVVRTVGDTSRTVRPAMRTVPLAIPTVRAPMPTVPKAA